MSKIDVLIIVHNEHEGLLSVGNSEHAHYGCARVGYWGTGKSGYLAKRNTRIYSRFINTFNPNFPKKTVLASYWYYYKSCSNTVQMYIISDTAMAAKLTQIVVLLLQHLLYL